MLGRFLATFAVVFLAELPDKTMVATLVLTATYRRAFWVWLGAAAAFFVHVTMAVLAGGLLSRLPEKPVKLTVAVLFAVASVMLWTRRDDPLASERGQLVVQGSRWRIAAVAFTTLLVAEIGDLTELTIASLAASSGQPIPVFFGGLLALWSVAALAAAGGVALLAKVPVRQVRTGASVVFAALAVVTVIEVLA